MWTYAPANDATPRLIESPFGNKGRLGKVLSDLRNYEEEALNNEGFFLTETRARPDDTWHFVMPGVPEKISDTRYRQTFILTPRSLEDGKAHAQEVVRQTATDMRTILASQADQYEVASWPNKKARADRVLAGTGTAKDQEKIKMEANLRGRGETVQELAQIQVDKGDALETAVATIDGKERNALDRIDKAVDLDDLIAVSDQLKAEGDALFAQLRPEETPVDPGAPEDGA